MSLLDVPGQYTLPPLFRPGKKYWGYTYSGERIFTKRGAPTVKFSPATIGSDQPVAGPRAILSVVSKYPKRLLKGIGTIYSGDEVIRKKFGEDTNVAGWYNTTFGLKPAEIYVSPKGSPETLTHEIAHHIHAQHAAHRPLLWHLKTNRGGRLANRIGGPTPHADKNQEEDFAETVGIIQTHGKKGFDEAYNTKMMAHNLSIAIAHQEDPKKKLDYISRYEVMEAEASRKKLFDFVAGRYGIPRRITTSDPTIPKSYQAGAFHGKIEYPSRPFYNEIPGATGLATASTNAYYGRAKVPVKASEYAGSPEESDKEAEALGKGGAIKPWPRTPKVIVKSVPNTYSKKYAPGIRTKGIFLGRKQVGELTYYPDGDIADIGVDSEYQRKGIGTNVLGQLLRKTGSVSGESSQGSGIAFWKKMGANIDYSYHKESPNVFPPFTLARTDYDAAQLDLRENKSHGPLNPEVAKNRIETPAGYISTSYDPLERHMHVEHIYVKPEARRKGQAKKLLAQAIEKTGAETVSASGGSQEGRAFFSGQGFEKRGSGYEKEYKVADKVPEEYQPPAGTLRLYRGVSREVAEKVKKTGMVAPEGKERTGTVSYWTPSKDLASFYALERAEGHENPRAPSTGGLLYVDLKLPREDYLKVMGKKKTVMIVPPTEEQKKSGIKGSLMPSPIRGYSGGEQVSVFVPGLDQYPVKSAKNKVSRFDTRELNWEIPDVVKGVKVAERDESKKEEALEYWKEEPVEPIENEETIAAELYSPEPFVKEGREKQKPLKNEEAEEASDEEILEQLYPEG